MARFTLPGRPTGFTGPDAKLQSLCALFKAMQPMMDAGDTPGNDITDEQMNALISKRASVLQAILLQPSPTTVAGCRAKAWVAHQHMIENLAHKSKIPWREQVAPAAAFGIDVLREIAEAQMI